MSLRLTSLPKNSKYLLGLIFLVATVFICLAFMSSAPDNSRREILLRKIGHELLLQSGDSSSRVLPITQTGKEEYQIRFEREFGFSPDSLMGITRSVLKQETYDVKVFNCGSTNLAYGFAVSKNSKNDIITCLGREMPKACYLVSIQFAPERKTLKYGYLLGGLVLMAGFAFMLWKPVSKEQPQSPDEPSEQPDNIFNLGSISFDPGTRTLSQNDVNIELTATETRILQIFAEQPNVIIERSRLQKEIWEDEGVIVGRSLDMFISKLRKKLEPDPTIKIVSIRGKGYRLEFN